MDPGIKKALILIIFNVDQTAGNVLINGILNVENVIRLDVVCSQNGNSFGNFGYFIDYLQFNI